MGSVFEVGMLLCFGASWPFNIVKSYRSRTAGGKSIGFELLIMVGYLCGIAGKAPCNGITAKLGHLKYSEMLSSVFKIG